MQKTDKKKRLPIVWQHACKIKGTNALRAILLILIIYWALGPKVLLNIFITYWALGPRVLLILII